MGNVNETKLEVSNVTLRFGGVIALADISLELKSGTIMSLIGPNGAGKTSLLNCMNGFYRPDSGHIRFLGEDITRLASHLIAAKGISRTFQNIELYTGLTVQDNIMAGRHTHLKRGVFWQGFHFGKAHKEEMENRRVVEDIIDFLEIESIRKKVVGTLPYGLRKRVELARALALEPEVLLLDEPMAGMNMEEKEDMARFILDIYDERTNSILLVEHDMEVVMDISHRVVVLDFGRKIAEGSPEEIKSNPEVIKAYLGASLD
jgi:branched-chain amino acid transport system ATP-binding protein